MWNFANVYCLGLYYHFVYLGLLIISIQWASLAIKFKQQIRKIPKDSLLRVWGIAYFIMQLVEWIRQSADVSNQESCIVSLPVIIHLVTFFLLMNRGVHKCSLQSEIFHLILLYFYCMSVTNKVDIGSYLLSSFHSHNTCFT